MAAKRVKVTTLTFFSSSDESWIFLLPDFLDEFFNKPEVVPPQGLNELWYVKQHCVGWVRAQTSTIKIDQNITCSKKSFACAR